MTLRSPCLQPVFDFVVGLPTSTQFTYSDLGLRYTLATGQYVHSSYISRVLPALMEQGLICKLPPAKSKVRGLEHQFMRTAKDSRPVRTPFLRRVRTALRNFRLSMELM